MAATVIPVIFSEAHGPAIVKALCESGGLPVSEANAGIVLRRLGRQEAERWRLVLAQRAAEAEGPLE